MKLTITKLPLNPVDLCKIEDEDGNLLATLVAPELAEWIVAAAKKLREYEGAFENNNAIDWSPVEFGAPLTADCEVEI